MTTFIVTIRTSGTDDPPPEDVIEEILIEELDELGYNVHGLLVKEMV